MRYRVIYADPPWRYQVWSKKGLGRSAESHYPTMATREIVRLPVWKIAAPDCVLLLWATFPTLPDALMVIAAWGFTYKTAAFVWVKTNRTNAGYRFGMGYWTRGNAEIVLLATHGNPHRASAAVPQIVATPPGTHSQKPAVVRERIVQLLGDVPRIELFAREQAPGWDALGLELDGQLLEESLPALARSAHASEMTRAASLVR